MADPNHAMVAAAMSQAGSSGASMAAVTAQMDQMALGFHRPHQQAALAAAAGAPPLQPKSKLSQVNPRKMFGPMDSSSMDDDATIDPKNFATIRTTSIVQRQQKEHLQEEMHEQMSGYKRMRRDHQAALARLEDNCRQEMEKHKNLLDREYEQLLTQFSKDLERLQVKHQEELAKTLKTNIATEKKLMKQITDEQSMERKSFDNKMSHEYKLKKEMWKREMSDRETSKREREAILSQHKEQHRELEAAQNQRLNRSQKETLDREVRKFRRRRLVKYHDLEQDLLREELNKRQSQLESAHAMLMRHHEQTHDLEAKQQRSVHNLREDHVKRQHQTELNNQDEYMRRSQRELKKKHAMELKQQPKSLKQKEVLIRKQFRDTCKIQTRQYKALKAQVLQTTAKEEQKIVIRKLKEEQRRKMALLGEQYEQTIADMLQKQSIRMDESQEREERVNVRRTLLEQKMEEETQQFLQERSERIRLLHERQAREVEQFDDESTRLGFSAMAIAESSREPGFGEDNVGGAPYHPLAHSNSVGSFSSSSSSSAGAMAAAGHHHHHHHAQ